MSKGEQRAFYILQLLFDVESRVQLNQKTLLILDDIADSFDYKNKYAIIEYIKELHQNAVFKLLILTHNFDFYRTVAKRLGLDRNRRCILMTLRNDKREIALVQGSYLNDIFSHFKNNLAKPKVFVSIIPLVRNLIEYIEGQSSQKYEKLTSCLHLKADTNTLKCSDILSLVHSSFHTTSNRSITFGAKPIKDFIFETADAIEQENPLDEILLENKIALSIAIRLKAEEYMLSKIPNSSTLVITSNQTSELLTHIKAINSDKNILTVLERVNLMTPENIHVNAFMFEPLIDIPIYHLVRLYKKVKLLT